MASVYENRTTSAGYRFPLQSRPRSSDFHQNCIPKEVKAHAAAASVNTQGQTSKHSEAAYGKLDAVTQDKVWKQAVDNEKKGVKSWEENWGFMTEFDAMGRPKTPNEVPEHVTTYSDNVPNTNAGNYGGRLNTEVGQTMQSLEFKFNSQNRKKKLGNDLICY